MSDETDPADMSRWERIKGTGMIALLGTLSLMLVDTIYIALSEQVLIPLWLYVAIFATMVFILTVTMEIGLYISSEQTGDLDDDDDIDDDMLP